MPGKVRILNLGEGFSGANLKRSILYLWTFALAQLHSAGNMEPFSVGELERRECGLEEFLYQVVLVGFRPSNLGRTYAGQQCWHDLKMEMVIILQEWLLYRSQRGLKPFPMKLR